MANPTPTPRLKVLGSGFGEGRSQRNDGPARATSQRRMTRDALGAIARATPHGKLPHSL
jgi:hypothetical protein